MIELFALSNIFHHNVGVGLRRRERGKGRVCVCIKRIMTIKISIGNSVRLK